MFTVLVDLDPGFLPLRFSLPFIGRHWKPQKKNHHDNQDTSIIMTAKYSRIIKTLDSTKKFQAQNKQNVETINFLYFNHICKYKMLPSLYSFFSLISSFFRLHFVYTSISKLNTQLNVGKSIDHQRTLQIRLDPLDIVLLFVQTCLALLFVQTCLDLDSEQLGREVIIDCKHMGRLWNRER